MKSFKLSLLQVSFLLFGALGGQAEAAVWAESNQWNQQWEDRFSDWIKNSFNEEIFVSGKYKDISTDCADAVYLSRAIFAYENKLPFVMLDPTGGNTKISNRMSRFDGSSNEFTRFKRFTTYISDMGDTKTLPKDTYPIAIRREYVRSGSVWSRPRIARKNFWGFLFGGSVKEDPGHAEVVKNVTETGAIELIGSTVPSAVRKLISTSSLVFMPIETSTGLRKWMEPEWYGQSARTLPGFSMEQFQMGASSDAENQKYDDFSTKESSSGRDLSDWTKEVQTRLQLREENKEEALYRMGTNLCNLVQARVDTILKSEMRRTELRGGTCMNAEDYDAYSTPSRDKRILATIEEMISVGGEWGFTTRGRLPKMRKYMERCPEVKITPEKSMRLYDIAMAYAKDDISSNPNDKITARWGLEEDNAGKDCPTY